MEPTMQHASVSSVRSRHSDWLSPTSDDDQELLIQRLDDLMDWSGGLSVCSAEREPTFADVRWRSLRA